MLRQISCRGRLLALLKDSFHSTTLAGNGLRLMAHTLFPSAFARDDTNFQSINKQEILPLPVYEHILSYVNKNLSPSNPYRDFRQLPHPDDVHVFARMATVIRHWKYNGHQYSVNAAHPGNSSISFEHNSIHDAGFIEQMWKVVIKGQSVLLMVISLHTTLSLHDELKNPYSQYPGLACQLVYSHHPALEHWIVISPDQIIGHVAYYNRPPGTFGIRQATMVIVNSLHQYRDVVKFQQL